MPIKCFCRECIRCICVVGLLGGNRPCNICKVGLTFFPSVAKGFFCTVISIIAYELLIKLYNLFSNTALLSLGLTKLTSSLTCASETDKPPHETVEMEVIDWSISFRSMFNKQE